MIILLLTDDDALAADQQTIDQYPDNNPRAYSEYTLIERMYLPDSSAKCVPHSSYIQIYT